MQGIHSFALLHDCLRFYIPLSRNLFCRVILISLLIINYKVNISHFNGDEETLDVFHQDSLYQDRNR